MANTLEMLNLGSKSIFINMSHREVIDTKLGITYVSNYVI